MKIKNPIIPGFYPDPSVCRANGKYYLVNSTFQYFPGVPIFESDDLVNWRQIGNALTRLDQVYLHKINSSGGVFAPTIRFDEKNERFYMVTNNNTTNKNFYIYTDDIYGEWSEPIEVDQGGIDPSLLFDDDGRVYFTTNGADEEGNEGICQCEINPATGEKLTKTTMIWSGAGGRYIESPHLYHIGEYYYIMDAEGGTEYGHMVSYARSKNPFGPFENYKLNPVLTNRNLGGHQSIIQGIGHGDLVQSYDGEWFIVTLGFRQIGQWMPFHTLGREVFMAGVTFDKDGWFTAGDNGIIKEYMDLKLPESKQLKWADITIENYETEKNRWLYIRDYNKSNYDITKNRITLTGSSVTLDEADSPTFMGVRQSSFDTEFAVDVESDATESGITTYMDEYQHYDVYVYNGVEGKKVRLRLRIGEAVCIKSEINISDKDAKIRLICESNALNYVYAAEVCGERYELGRVSSKYLTSEVAGGFTGVVEGIYCVDEKDRKSVFSNLKFNQY